MRLFFNEGTKGSYNDMSKLWLSNTNLLLPLHEQIHTAELWNTISITKVAICIRIMAIVQ